MRKFYGKTAQLKLLSKFGNYHFVWRIKLTKMRLQEVLHISNKNQKNPAYDT